jgi:hypothetical protein
MFILSFMFIFTAFQNLDLLLSSGVSGGKDTTQAHKELVSVTETVSTGPNE